MLEKVLIFIKRTKLIRYIRFFEFLYDKTYVDGHGGEKLF